MNRIACFAAVATVALTAAAAARDDVACGMPDRVEDPHLVLHDRTGSMLWVRPMHVDADGAPNAYHRDDPHGNRGLAIEYIGNGMTIFRNGKPIEFKPKQEENEEWLSAYRRIVRNGWKAPHGYEIDIYGFARDRDDKVCVVPGGRLVSSTSLSFSSNPDYCSQSRYLDALKFPGIVVPNRDDDEDLVPGGDPEVAPPFAGLGVRRGDLAVAYNPETGIWKGAILYDTGPREKLGEGSIRLVMNLTGRTDPPRSGDATNSMTIRETYVLLFPGSVGDLGDENEWTPEKIESAAAERFRQWGGGTITSALKRLFACAERYEKHKP
jgi:hypothetical protein